MTLLGAHIVPPSGLFLCHNITSRRACYAQRKLYFAELIVFPARARGSAHSVYCTHKLDVGTAWGNELRTGCSAVSCRFSHRAVRTSSGSRNSSRACLVDASSSAKTKSACPKTKVDKLVVDLCHLSLRADGKLTHRVHVCYYLSLKLQCLTSCLDTDSPRVYCSLELIFESLGFVL